MERKPRYCSYLTSGKDTPLGQWVLGGGGNFGTILGGALIGGAAGLVGFGVGNAVGGAGFFGSKAVATTMGFGAKIAGGASGGLVSGGLGTAIYGGNLGQNLLNGLVGGALGGIAPSFGGVGILPGAGLGALSGGLAGGVISELTGGSFIDGFTQGAVAGAISGGIYGGIAASKTLYDRNLLFGNLTKSGREQAFLDFSRQYNLQASGAQNIKFEDLSNAYGQTAPLDSNGKPISLAKAARNYPNGVDSEVTFGSNRMMSLKKIEANVLHERQHVIDLRAGKATQFLNASKTNMGFRGRFEVSAHRAVYNLGIQKSYNLARIKYWQQFK